ncbi:MAG TPA: pitrilysin family protein [Bryobacteraceae bacterium]|nr:pitrilysin family protein [Bryobacteraceae bacterium]
MKTIATYLLLMTATLPAMDVVAMPGQSPLIQFRFVFRTGAANDPPERPGTAAFTAAMLAGGGTKALPYQQVLDALYPMAAQVDAQVDKEMIVFSGTTHADNLEAYYTLLRDMLLTPGWREEDLKRIRDHQRNEVRLALRENNDEELGKEVLYSLAYAGHPYGHLTLGTLRSIDAMTMGELQAFYKAHLTQANLTIGIAGKYPAGFVERMKKDFSALPAGKASAVKLPPAAPLRETRVTIVQKKTRAVAFSMGYPIAVTRNHPDFPALLVANVWFGAHRSSGGNLYQRMREIRGLNYGDYSYIEYFPNGMFQFEPDPNHFRRSQIFQIWIRPVEPPTAHFALRLALFELGRLVDKGMTEAEFETTRDFLSLNVNLLMKTKSAELGYAIDSKAYGIPEYTTYIQSALKKLKYEDVQKAIRTHLRKDRLQVVAISDHAEELKKQLVADEPSPMRYNAPKPGDIVEEDKIVSTLKLGWKTEQITVVPVETVFQ